MRVEIKALYHSFLACVPVGAGLFLNFPRAREKIKISPTLIRETQMARILERARETGI